MERHSFSPDNRTGRKVFHGLYYRRRILLAILAQRKRRIEKLRLQKLLFLFTQQQEKPAYYFLPYKYGSYSFQASEDARILACHYGLIINSRDDSYSLNKKNVKEEYFALKDTDHDRLAHVYKQYGPLSTKELIYQVYKQYPYYAVRSEIIGEQRFKALHKSIKKEQLQFQTSNGRRCLYTIGYEGISIEQYISRLMRNGISALVDVRRNPFSMKYGFSKTQLRRITKKFDIEYYHIPELGVESDRRVNLTTRADYNQLFRMYRRSLRQEEESLQCIQTILREHLRTALTCFEKKHEWYHRGILSEAIHAQCGITVKHF